MHNILITGASGFLGSHIAEELINQGFHVVGLKRSTSNLWRCVNFKDRIQWIDCDNLTYAEKDILKCEPEIFIHAAWNGVRDSDRNNWKMQEENLLFLVSLFEIVRKTKISKIISLGSQAEYGHFEGVVDEDSPCNPNSAYSASKVCASILLKTFAEQYRIDWYWIRIFSVFGPREEKNWFIPAVINNLLEMKDMELTPCEQRYDYLFTKDFAAGILSVVKNSKSFSGIYNMSSGKSIKLKDILNFLETKLSPNKRLLQIGTLPYRPNQTMYMQGKSDRFFHSFNFKPTVSLQEGLEETIKFYLIRKNNELRSGN